MDERCFDRNIEYDYSNAKMIIARILSENDDDLELEYIGGTSGTNRDVWKEFKTLEKGDYFVFVEVDWIDGVDVSNYVLSSYGSCSAFFIRD